MKRILARESRNVVGTLAPLPVDFVDSCELELRPLQTVMKERRDIAPDYYLSVVLVVVVDPDFIEIPSASTIRFMRRFVSFTLSDT